MAQSIRATEFMQVSTQEAYASWASVYDTDGNFLQATDDQQISDMLLDLLTRAGASLIPQQGNPADLHPELTPKILIDLGCGTGRNTFKLSSLTDPYTTTIFGLDGSPEMLAIAQQKADDLARGQPISDSKRTVPTFFHFDINNQAKAAYSQLLQADIVISTLVIEHIELKQFFGVAARLIKDGGHLLLTNMHEDMGRISQAGFVNEDGVKVQMTSFAHSIEDVCTVARDFGFHFWDIREKMIREDDVESLGTRSKKWIGVKCWFGISFKKRLIK